MSLCSSQDVRRNDERHQSETRHCHLVFLGSASFLNVMWQRHKILWGSIAAGWMLIALSFTLNYFFFSRHYVAIFSTPPTLLQMLVWEIP